MQSQEPVLTVEGIRDRGRLLSLNLKDKYADGHFTGSMGIPHVRQLRADFFQKRLHKQREHEENWFVCMYI